MNKEYLNVIIVDDDEGNTAYFTKIFEDLKISVQLNIFENYKESEKYLNSDFAVIPDLLMMNFENSLQKCFDFLYNLKGDHRFNDIITAVYAEDCKDSEIEDLLIKGANIYFKKPGNYSQLKKTVSEIVTVSWQYHTSGLNKDHMIMKFN